MKILHYTLGLFPKRAGGLNRYATDLMKEESIDNDVFLLVPGRWRPFCKKCRVSKGKRIEGLTCFYLINALPQPILYGIKTPRDFMSLSISVNSFELFYEQVKPDVFHIHTFMGLPESVLRFFKDKGVKIVYTSHDYYGICPKVNLINQDGVICDGPSPSKCIACNEHSKGTIFLRLRSSKLIYTLRDIVRWLKNMINF